MLFLNNYAFESKPKSQWPNVISLEFCINIVNEWDSAKEVDKLIFYLIYKQTLGTQDDFLSNTSHKLPKLCRIY